jgi:hypothetical protein
VDASPHAKAVAHTRPAALRRLLGALAAVAVLAAIPSPASAATEAAKTAGSFVESIGVNVHTGFDDTPYGQNFPVVEQRLAELGVRHVRDGLLPSRPDQYERLNALAGAGIESDLILGNPDEGAAGLEELVSTLKTNLQGSVDAVEGPNEFDTQGGPEWAPRLADYQQRLYDAVKSDPAFAALPVIGPSVVQRHDEEALGDISSRLDYGNIHPYPNGGAPEGNLGTYLERAALNAGSKPVMATESGYDTALNSTGELQPVSEEAMATYMPRLFLEYFGRGIARTYAYELLDEWPDPGLGEPQSNFGLLHNDLSPKPAFTALRNTIAILSDPGPEFTPESIDYALGGDTAELHQVLLQKRDGSFYLALWRASSVWDPASRTPIAAPSAPVTLDFGRAVIGAERFLPNQAATPAGPVPSRGGELSVGVGPQVVILRLRLGVPLSRGRIKLWVAKRSVPAGGRVAVRGKLPRQLAGSSLRVKVQSWHKRHWRTVGHSHTSRSGVFRKTIRVSASGRARRSRLRVVARRTKPSKPVRVRIRD